jgi:hypothetical protein
VTIYEHKKMYKVSRLLGEVIGTLRGFITIHKHNQPSYGFLECNETYTNELIHRLQAIELYDYSIDEYLEYQEHVSLLKKEYFYIGEHLLDENSQFLWKRIYLSNGETIEFDSHYDLLEYINKNFVTDVKIINEKIKKSYKRKEMQ